MSEASAVYLGKVVEKDSFRTFIYAPNGQQKLVKSWEDFQNHMASGLWFASKEDAIVPAVAKKPRADKKNNEKTIKDETCVEDLGFEVKKDDFLPN